MSLNIVDIESQDDILRLVPFPKPQISDSTKLKEFADNNFNIYENGRWFSNRVENMGKGQVARHEQFLLFPWCFQENNMLQTHKNRGLYGKGLKIEVTVQIIIELS